MGGKTSTSTQTVSIPPEVLARYNAVNARAEKVAEEPFKKYEGQFVAPLTHAQQLGIYNTYGASVQAQPYYQKAMDMQKYAQDQARATTTHAFDPLYSGYNMAHGLAGQAGSAYTNAYNLAFPHMQEAGTDINRGVQWGERGTTQGFETADKALGKAEPMMGYAQEQIVRAQGRADPANAEAMRYAMAAKGEADPYQREATQGVYDARNLGDQYLGGASLAALSGGQEVNQRDLETDRYMNPYTREVADTTYRALRQQQEQEMAGQTGNAIRAGAFGGDRAGLAAANLSRQQSLATAQAMAPIYERGYGQALQTAQQQQGVDLSARQANRAAQQQMSQQLAALGQQGYGQRMGAAQQLEALGQGAFGRGMQSAQTLSGLGQTQYAQALGSGQAAGQLGSQIYDQYNRQAQLYSQLGNTGFQQGMAAAQQRQNLGQGMANLGNQYGQNIQGLGQQYFNQGQGMSQQIANLGMQNYNIGANTAQNYANFGTGAQQAALQGTQALIGAGTLEQQTKQAEATAQYQQFLQERGYPFQVAQFLANIAMGTGALSGSTTTTTQPSSFFSDERLKEDITPVGETFDGQTIYRFRYKGEKAHQIGLIAQEVEKTHPEAVGRSQGFKTVDYDAATHDAAKLGLGAAKMDRRHRAPGGLVPADDLRAILMSQKEAFGPFSQAGLYGGSAQQSPMDVGASYVPKAALPVGKLMTAGPAPKAPESGVSQLKGLVNTGEKLFGKEGLLGKGGLGEKVASKVTGLAGGDAPKPAAGGLAPSSASTASAAGVAAGSPAPVEEKGFLEKARDNLSDILDTTSKALNYNAGGRTGYAGLGKVVDPMKLQNPAEGVNAYIEDATENQDDENALPKPGAAPGEKSSGLKEALGLASSAAGLMSAAPKAAAGISSLIAMLPFSDARLKDNIRPVGKTYDGQTVYAYDMGDGRTQMGLIAQEVARHKPNAVGEAGGFLTVDYNRATEDAVPGLAPRERASGGLVPRHGYANGGEPYNMAEEHPADVYFEKYVIPRESGGKQFDAEGRPLTSSAGAIGIAQVMPKTAPEAARYAGVEFDENRYRTDPEYNKTLGKAYFRRMYDDFAGGDPARAMAAYNAGPGGLQRALSKAGDGGDWRAHLPAETRKYIAGVGDIPASDAQVVSAGLAPPTTKERNALYDFLPTKRDERGEESINWKKTLVPVLTGLGAMASSPSRYLGSAILQGLGAGAQAYADLDKSQAEIDRMNAATVGIALESAQKATFVDQNGRTMVNVPGRGFITREEWIKLGKPSLTGSTMGDYYVRKLLGESANPPAAPGLGGASVQPASSGAPSSGGLSFGAPSAPAETPSAKPAPGASGPLSPASAPATELPKDYTNPQSVDLFAPAKTIAAREASEIDNLEFRGDRERRTAANMELADRARAEESSAQKLKAPLKELARPLSAIATGEGIPPGVLSPYLFGISKVVNNIADGLGFPPVVDPTNVSQSELADKARALLTQARTADLDQRAVSSLDKIQQALAGKEMTREAFAGIAAEQLAENLKEEHRAAFVRRYATSGSIPIGSSAIEAYNKQYPEIERRFAAEKKALEKMLLTSIPGHGPLIDFMLGYKTEANGKKITPDVINQMFGYNLSKYFVN